MRSGFPRKNTAGQASSGTHWNPTSNFKTLFKGPGRYNSAVPGERVRIETASPEAVYFISSLDARRSVEEMIAEFDIEVLDDYLDRARAERKKYLPKD